MMSNLFPGIWNGHYKFYYIYFVYITIAFILDNKEKTIHNTLKASCFNELDVSFT